MEFIKEITTNHAGRQQPSAEGCVYNLPAPGSVHSLVYRAVSRCARYIYSDLFMESPAVFTHNSDPPTMLSFLGELSNNVENAEGVPAGVVVGHMWNQQQQHNYTNLHRQQHNPTHQHDLRPRWN